MEHFANAIYSKKLKFLRQQLELNQETMAANLNMSQQSYCKLEKGKTNFTYQRIQEICRVSKIQEKDFVLLEVFAFQKSLPVNMLSLIIDDSRIEALNKHYEILLMESELCNIKLEQRLRNYKPYQKTSGKDNPLVYVII